MCDESLVEITQEQEALPESTMQEEEPTPPEPETGQEDILQEQAPQDQFEEPEEPMPGEDTEPADDRLCGLCEEIKIGIETSREETAALERLLRQYIKENVEYREQVRGKMEKKLEEYRKKESGDVFNPILSEIAQLYVSYLPLFEEEELSDKARGNIDSLFEQLEDILLDYDAKVFRTPVGSRRELPRMSKIARSIPTDDESLAGTVACNRRPGIVKNERMVLAHELVDIYVYEPSKKEDANENIEEEN
ncbi:MAG: hypothetical protein IKR76_08975 [Ruminococcus sp.]|nr:hypothetical protein [Ruminococcus sp.]